VSSVSQVCRSVDTCRVAESRTHEHAVVMRTAIVVEDDPTIRLVLRTNLEAENCRVLECETAESALVQMQDGQPDIVLVDLRLPGIHGLDLVRSLRARSEVPIIIVTANTDTRDVIAGLEAGADDYVTKPFATVELMARVRRQLQRAGSLKDAAGILRCGPIELRTETFEVLRDGQSVQLSRIEFDVLHELMSANGKVLSRDHLLRTVWGYSNAGDGRVVDNLIYRLRGKIERDPSRPEHLLTLRGFGYQMKD
jgi:DNA-binding response OmpR family regulator